MTPSRSILYERSVVDSLGPLPRVTGTAERLNVLDVAGAAHRDGNNVVNREWFPHATTEAAMVIAGTQLAPFLLGEAALGSGQPGSPQLGSEAKTFPVSGVPAPLDLTGGFGVTGSPILHLFEIVLSMLSVVLPRASIHPCSVLGGLPPFSAALSAAGSARFGAVLVPFPVLLSEFLWVSAPSFAHVCSEAGAAPWRSPLPTTLIWRKLFQRLLGATSLAYLGHICMFAMIER